MARYYSTYGTMAATAPAPKKGIIEWIGKYWFQIFLVLLCLHVFLQKDISIRVNMRSLGSALESGMEGKALPASLYSAASASTFSLMDPGAGKGASGASAFYYLLNPKAAKKDEIPRDMLEQELDRSRKLVERFARVALTERSKFHIPAAILLAQAILASENGQSPLVKDGNNYFALTKEGEYRRFQSAWEGFREHSKVMGGEEYKALQKIPLTDYKGWAKGLQESGFSAERDYAKNLVRIVELLDLDQFDKV
ncbi:MAG: glucosaminidase domain-containing protein [Saprospirales bacterium]|jgi:hypothetical protein|nr:glucosaminidase domain-containing protein [Saprospirales bacterium]MBK6902873.1 glucosaminidase domain-containing protein [Saprospirales bacterium]MBK7337576.1 glucosaminidase domain-containing protein [Saprospirales bacterium]